jgi:dihydroneopterin aldolase / 2-amino-4-hydroxy-6-hydroxymethyldihydropteridine diphosphokinase
LLQKDYIVLTGLKVRCIIGIFDWERKEKQDILIDLKFPCDIRKVSRRDNITDTFNYKKIAKSIIAFVEKSQYQLIETLAEKLADSLIKNFQIPEIYLSVSKPGAVRGSQNVGVEIYRRSSDIKTQKFMYLSLGSNIHPRKNILLALSEISKRYSILGQSHIYETSPVGYTLQKPFWNLVVAMEARESPNKVRKWIELQEKKAGRVPIHNPFGPRPMDIDLILWGNQVKQYSEFALPHPDIETKAFVLFPLLEINPNFMHPLLKKPLIELAAKFNDSSQKIRQLASGIFPDFQPKKLNE